MRSRAFVAGLLAISVTAIASHGAEPFLDTWDNGQPSGWTGASAWTTVYAEPVGGSPDGWLHAVADGTTGTYFAGIQTFKAVATGDYGAAAMYGVAVEARVVVGTPLTAFFRLRSGSTGNGWTYLVSPTALTTDWTSIAAPIDPDWTDAQAVAAGWVNEDPTGPGWAELLSDITSLAFRAFSGSELELGYDNFHLRGAAPCFADLDGSGTVDGADLGLLLGAWGASEVIADLDRNGIVDGADLGLLLGSWGPCDPALPCGAPGSGGCCVAHPAPGCDDLDCCESVCAIDDYCCAVAWDTMCADVTVVLCPDPCGP